MTTIRIRGEPSIKGDLGRLIGRTKGGMNTRLNAVSDADGRPLSFLMTAGQVSDYTGTAALLGDLPKAQWLLRRPWLRRRLVQGRPGRQGHPTLHFGPQIAQRAGQIRQAPLPAPQPHSR